MRPLTQKQMTILAFLQKYSQDNGFPPTMREIGQGIGLSNVSAVRGHLAALEKKGYISKNFDKARSLRVLHSPSVFSRLKKKLHEIVHTDKGVFHRIIYGIALITKGKADVFSGPVKDVMAGELEKQAVEHGWKIIKKQIESDCVMIIVEVWPNHSAELVVRRIRAVGNAVAKQYLKKWPVGNIWPREYAITTEVERMNELITMLRDATKLKSRESD